MKTGTIQEPAIAPTVSQETCEWCGRIGALHAETERISTAGGEKFRCIDRQFCRSRATYIHEHLLTLGEK